MVARGPTILGQGSGKISRISETSSKYKTSYPLGQV